MNQKTPCLQMLSWKLHVRTSVSPRKSPFIVFITPSIPNKNGGDRLRKMSISSIFEEEILENCRFWEVPTSGFGLCIRNSFSKRLFVPQNTAYIGHCFIIFKKKVSLSQSNRSKSPCGWFTDFPSVTCRISTSKPFLLVLSHHIT